MTQPRTPGEQLAVIAESVKRIERNQDEAGRERADQARMIGALSKKTDDMARRLSEVEPVTKMVTSWHARIVGAVMLLGFLGAVVMSAAGIIWMLLKDRLSAVWQAIIGG